MSEPTGAAFLPMPTDTAHVRIESRQYRLFKIDLGEGVPRIAMKVGAFVFPPWFLLCAVLGISIISGLMIWLGPPSLLTWRAMSLDDGGRRRYRGWLDHLGWLLRGHRPIVNAGMASSTPARPIVTELSFTVIDLDAPEPGAPMKGRRFRGRQDQAD
jgi:hypothetical protein